MVPATEKKMEYVIILRSGQHINHSGSLNSTTCYGYLLLIADGHIVAEHRIADVAKVKVVK
jgi:hypothetical protein